jgi:sugar-phosphatase
MWQGFFPDAFLEPERIRKRLLELVGGEVRSAGLIKPGALRAIGLCIAAGCRIGLASSSPPEIIAAGLERLGMARHFSAVASSEAESHGKPHPAVYLTSAKRLGVDPGACIAFEDSVPGAQAAKAAGMFTVAVPEEHNRGRPEYAIADLVLDSLEDLPESILADRG